jgi:glycyl-tRNA synthetase
VVLKLNPKLAPYKIAVFPLLKNKPELAGKAREIYQSLLKLFPVAWDERGNIGKRYYSQDEIGTPFCVTVDFGTLGEGDDAKLKDTVTVRDRDTMEQKRMAIDELAEYFKEKLSM